MHTAQAMNDYGTRSSEDVGDALWLVGLIGQRRPVDNGHKMLNAALWPQIGLAPVTQSVAHAPEDVQVGVV